MSSLAGKVAVVTGGNSGIGLATAKEFHANGAKVAISGRDRGTLDEVARQLGERGQFPVLREAQTERAGDFLHRFRLCAAADAADRQANRNGGTNFASSTQPAL